MHNKYVEYIQYALSNKPISYQLGFLQSFIANQMLKDSKILNDFKRTVTKADENNKLGN